MELIKVALTALLSAVALFLIAKLLGHKQMAQLDFFDYITGITIGSIGAELATELEAPLKPLIAMIIYGLIAIALSKLSDKVLRLRKYINGTPTILMDKGKLYRENMKKAKIELSELMVLLRQEGYFNINDIETAVYEYNGRISVLPKSEKRPLTPEDMSINPKKSEFLTEIIMDGRILHENLTKKGLDLNWLYKELKKQKYKNPEEIFLGVCDSDNLLTLFPIE